MEEETEIVVETSTSWRQSSTLPLVVLFLAFANESALMTYLIPVLPRLLSTYYCTAPIVADNNYSTISYGNNTAWEIGTLNYTHNTTVWNEIASNTLDLILDNNDPTSGPESINSTLNVTENCDNDTISQHIGLIAGIGPIVEFSLNPLIAYSISCIGGNSIFCFGSIVQLSGLIVFMLVMPEWGLFLGRILHAIGTVSTDVSGLTLLAERVGESKRIRAFATAQTGVTVGLLVGYPLGGVLFDMFGSIVPLTVLASVSVLDLVLRLLIPKMKKNMGDTGIENQSLHSTNTTERKQNKCFKILSDPYLLVGTFITFLCYHNAIALLATLPYFLINTATQWQVGVLYLCATLVEGSVQLLAANVVKTHGQRFFTIVAMLLLQGLGTLALAFCDVELEVWYYIIPLAVIRVGTGVTGALMSSLLMKITDIRRLGGYNIVFSLFVAAYTLSFGLGPIIGGFLVPYIGFHGVCFTLTGISGLAMALTFSLRNIPAIVINEIS